MTKEEWGKIVEEFGEDAYKIVYYHHFPTDTGDKLRDNEAVDMLINSGHINRIKLKPIHELIAHGIEYHGDDEYLMWSFAHTKSSHPDSEFIECGFASNTELLCHEEYDYVNRKTSAELPFDFERAVVRGDIVEWINNNGELETIIGITCINYQEKRCTVITKDNVAHIGATFVNLRMKYPPRAQK